MNSDWIELITFYFGWLPKNIIDEAKSLKPEADEKEISEITRGIAKSKNIEPGTWLSRWFPRAKIEEIDFIQQDPDFPEYSNIIFIDDDFLMVKMNTKKLMSKIHKFLLQEPKYKFQTEKQQIEFHPYPIQPDFPGYPMEDEDED